MFICNRPLSAVVAAFAAAAAFVVAAELYRQHAECLTETADISATIPTACPSDGELPKGLGPRAER